MTDVLTIILGGGKGTRLYPLTKYRSKPAVPIGGKYRLIDITLSNCVHSGFNRVYVLTQFMSVSLNQHVASAYSFDHLRRGFVDTIPASQGLDTSDGWFLGTADAVRKSMMHFHQHRFTDYLILSGDHIYRMDYRQILDLHREKSAEVTVATLPVPESRISSFGIMRTDSKGRIVDFVEKPEDPTLATDFRNPGQYNNDSEPSYNASMGIYIFRRGVLEQLLRDCPGNDFGYDIVPYAIKHNDTYCFKFDGYWEDIGRVSDFYTANIRLTEPEPIFNFYDPKHPIFTRPRHLPGSILDNTELKESIICEGCVINNACISQSVIGIRSKVCSGSRIQRVLMLGADYYEGEDDYPNVEEDNPPAIGVGPGCDITGAIIDKNARLGEGVIIKPKKPDENYSGEGYVVKDGITVIIKNAVIPAGTVI